MSLRNDTFYDVWGEFFQEIKPYSSCSLLSKGRTVVRPFDTLALLSVVRGSFSQYNGEGKGASSCIC